MEIPHTGGSPDARRRAGLVPERVLRSADSRIVRRRKGNHPLICRRRRHSYNRGLMAQHIDAALLSEARILAACAGNLTITGSIANIIVVERAAAEGVQIGFGEFLRVGVPVTVATLGWGAAWLWMTG